MEIWTQPPARTATSRRGGSKTTEKETLPIISSPASKRLTTSALLTWIKTATLIWSSPGGEAGMLLGTKIHGSKTVTCHGRSRRGNEAEPRNGNQANHGIHG